MELYFTSYLPLADTLEGNDLVRYEAGEVFVFLIVPAFEVAPDSI